MIKQMINSYYFKWFRKSFLNKIYNTIEHGNTTDYCCNVKSWHTLFICWKDLKEVKENMNSDALSEFIKKNISKQDCSFVWFPTRKDRLKFLKECLDKFK